MIDFFSVVVSCLKQNDLRFFWLPWHSKHFWNRFYIFILRFSEQAICISWTFVWTFLKQKYKISYGYSVKCCIRYSSRKPSVKNTTRFVYPTFTNELTNFSKNCKHESVYIKRRCCYYRTFKKSTVIGG